MLRRRGAEEAGAVFVKVSRLDGTADVFAPAPQTAFDEARPADRVFAPALKVIPVGVAYAIWAGIGIVAAALIGTLAFNERLGAAQLVCIALVLIGAAGLRLTTSA